MTMAMGYCSVVAAASALTLMKTLFPNDGNIPHIHEFLTPSNSAVRGKEK